MPRIQSKKSSSSKVVATKVEPTTKSVSSRRSKRDRKPSSYSNEEDEEDNVLVQSIFDKKKDKKAKIEEVEESPFEREIQEFKNISQLKEKLNLAMEGHRKFIEQNKINESEKCEDRRRDSLQSEVKHIRQIIFNHIQSKVIDKFRRRFGQHQLDSMLAVVHQQLKIFQQSEAVEVANLELDLDQLVANFELYQVEGQPPIEHMNFVILPAYLFHLIYLQFIGKISKEQIDVTRLVAVTLNRLRTHLEVHSSNAYEEVDGGHRLPLCHVFLAFLNSWATVGHYFNQKTSYLLPSEGNLSHFDGLFDLPNMLFTFYRRYLAILMPYLVGDKSIAYFLVAVYDWLVKEAYFFRAAAIAKVRITHKEFFEVMLAITSDDGELSILQEFFDIAQSLNEHLEREGVGYLLGAYYLLIKSLPRSLDYVQPLIAYFVFEAINQEVERIKSVQSIPTNDQNRLADEMEEDKFVLTSIIINFDDVHQLIEKVDVTKLSSEIVIILQYILQAMVVDLCMSDYKLSDFIFVLLNLTHLTQDTKVALWRLMSILANRLNRPPPIEMANFEVGNFFLQNCNERLKISTSKGDKGKKA